VDYVKRLIRLRHFLISLVRNDLNNRYRRSVLGIAWSLARPLGMTLVLSLVFNSMFGGGRNDYIPYLFLGLSVWQFFVETIKDGCLTFSNGAAYIRQQPLPLLLFPIRAALVGGFHTAIAILVAMAIAFCVVGPPPLVPFLSLVPALFLIFMLGVAFASVFGAMHTLFPDTQHLLEIVLQGLYFLTPIMIRTETFAGRRIETVIKLNPFTSVLELVRAPLLNGECASAGHWLMVISFTACSGMLAFLVMRKVQRELVFWV
jgi:lipopolysaccharide transport system permease protein